MDSGYYDYMVGLDPQALRDTYARRRLSGNPAPFKERAQVGLGRFTNAMFPVPREVSSQVDPETIKQMRAQALIQAGLGILAANESGRGLGGSLLAGLGQGQQAMKGGLGEAWAATRVKREDERLDWYKQKHEEDLKYRREKDDETAAYRAEQDRIEEDWRQKNYDLAVENAMAIAGRAAADDARQAEALRLQREGVQLDRTKFNRESKRRVAADLAAKALGKMTPQHPRYGEMTALYEAMTGKKWDGGKGLYGGVPGIAGPANLNDIPID